MVWSSGLSPKVVSNCPKAVGRRPQARRQMSPRFTKSAPGAEAHPTFRMSILVAAAKGRVRRPAREVKTGTGSVTPTAFLPLRGPYRSLVAMGRRSLGRPSLGRRKLRVCRHGTAVLTTRTPALSGAHSSVIRRQGRTQVEVVSFTRRTKVVTH